MNRLRIVLSILAIIMGILWWGIIDYHRQVRNLILDSWNSLQLQIVRGAARSAETWLHVRINEQGISKEQAEQEVFHKYVDPMLLLKSGAAWIYNKAYVIYDKNRYFPEIYKDKNMSRIFEVQKEYGASHYEALCSGVMNGTEGTGWYIWRPESGREFVAWTPIRLGYDTWTIGLSTPELEIYEYFRIREQFRRELIAGILISLLILIVSSLILQYERRNRTVMNMIKAQSSELAVINNELRYQLNEREKVENEREQLLIQLEKKYKEERDAWREVSFRAAHKMGNAIFGLRGVADWLQSVFHKKPLNEIELESAITETRQGLNDANSIIRDFKNYYRPDKLCPEYISVNRVLENAVNQIEKAAGKDVVIIKDFDPNLPPMGLDKTKFKQCITELIENACHFMDHHGKIIIHSAYSTEEEKHRVGIKGDSISITVKDDGIGVPEENKRLLFYPFFSTNSKGSGMGLAIVQQYVELHGGKIAEIGKSGSGAEFLILLPIHRDLLTS